MGKLVRACKLRETEFLGCLPGQGGGGSVHIMQTKNRFKSGLSESNTDRLDKGFKAKAMVTRFDFQISIEEVNKSGIDHIA